MRLNQILMGCLEMTIRNKVKRNNKNLILERIKEALKLMKMFKSKFVIWVTAVGHITTSHQRFKLGNIVRPKL